MHTPLPACVSSFLSDAGENKWFCFEFALKSHNLLMFRTSSTPQQNTYPTSELSAWLPKDTADTASSLAAEGTENDLALKPLRWWDSVSLHCPVLSLAECFCFQWPEVALEILNLCQFSVYLPLDSVESKMHTIYIHPLRAFYPS